MQSSRIGKICKTDWDPKHLSQAPPCLGGCRRRAYHPDLRSWTPLVVRVDKPILVFLTHAIVMSLIICNIHSHRPLHFKNDDTCQIYIFIAMSRFKIGLTHIHPMSHVFGEERSTYLIWHRWKFGNDGSLQFASAKFFIILLVWYKGLKIRRLKFTYNGQLSLGAEHYMTLDGGLS